MGSKVLLLLISAISLVQVTVSVELHLVKINKTWSEAQSYCREHYTDLVSIRSTQEVEKINTTVQDVQTERVWIGLFRNNTSQQWQWSIGDYFMYLNWEKKPPYTDLYAVIVGKQWLDKPSSTFYFICQKVAERDSSALKGYYLVTEFKSWTDAQQHCRNNGSELASIRNQEEQEALNTVNTETSRFVWIGLYRESNSQPWKWSNGDPIEKWDSGEPDLSNTQDVCVSMNGNAPGRAPGFWNDRSCTERFYFLCSGELKTTTPATPTTTPATTPATPTTTPATTPATPTTTPATPTTTPATPTTTPATTPSPKTTAAKSTAKTTTESQESNPTNNEPGTTALSTETKDSTEPGERRVLRIYITAPEGRDPEDPQIRDAILAEIQRSYSGQTPSQDLKLRWREIDGKIFHKQEDDEEEGGTCPKP
ncbi:secretory phospholipase A2 receptor-like [Acipenser ruthenus]|uniref:secretory phospholipase A2 receptor-like n=1 Tax=Acipenser ruthenus TaxID=7906 RepID=UPI002741F3E8|nr:secretory phospholipase A2 receptor-like [Acipenser ruthenus]